MHKKIYFSRESKRIRKRKAAWPIELSTPLDKVSVTKFIEMSYRKGSFTSFYSFQLKNIEIIGTKDINVAITNILF